MNNPINPSHYQSDCGVQSIDIAEHLGFCGGNAFKYAWRAGLKDDMAQDLQKCRWYLQRLCHTKTRANRVKGLEQLVFYLAHRPKHAYSLRGKLLVAIAKADYPYALSLVERAIAEI